MNKTKIGLCVVTYNQYEITKNFLERFYFLFGEEKYIKLLVLDNNSIDNSFEKLKIDFPQLDIRRLNDNYGCVTGRNIGIIELIKEDCEYIYHSDNDIYFEDKNYFKKILSFHLAHPDYSGSCPIVRYYSNKEIQTAGTRIYKFGIIKNVNEISANNIIHILPGGAQMIKSECYIKYGLFDNDLSPVSIEDREWGIRVSKLGGKFVNNKDVEVFHDHKNIKIISNDRISTVIRGNIVFLRNYFTIFNLLKEIKTLFFYSRKAGYLFTLKSYYYAFNKKINKNNYIYIKFKKYLDDNYNKIIIN